MKKLVIIAGVVYPEPSPPGKIALQFANILKNDYNITMVIMQTSLNKVDNVDMSNIKFYSVFGLRLYIENFFLNKYSKTRFYPIKLFCKFGVIILKSIGRIQNMLLFPNNLRWYYKGALRKLLKINKIEKIDIIFSICYPFSAHLAALKFKQKNKNVKWITYTVDPYSTSERLNNIALFPKYRNKYNSSYEHYIYSKSDYNLVSEEIFQTESTIINRFKFKTSSIPYLLSEPQKKSISFLDKSYTNLIFAGRFYKDIRNPIFLLSSFLNVNNNSIILHLFSQSNCEVIIDEYIRKANGRIIKHNYVSQKEIMSVLVDADILINVGNSTSSFKPSKIFEYISTGKPIINFYRNNNLDDVLIKYPNSLQINEDEKTHHESAKLIEHFCLSQKGKYLEWNKIEEIYPLNSTKNIKNILMKALNY